ncbi:hypothetical protein K504DRAFT_394618, partial [Pleomassaria siparia CBS 279.74]
MMDLLECDSRPTFVLDITAVSGSCEDAISPVYWNPALATTHSGSLFDALIGKASANSTEAERVVTFSRFQRWTERGEAKCFVYCGFTWFKFLVAGRWNVISGSSSETSTLGQNEGFEGSVLSKKTSRSRLPTLDWTDELAPVRVSPHVAWARSIDWASTQLGPMKSWSSQLRSIANLIMQDPRPAVLFFGPDLIMIYNEAYVELLGDLHPCMGVGARVALSLVWPEYFEPIITQNLAGETVEKTNTPVHMVRSGFLEETYFSLKFIPIFDADGATVGHYEPLVETTREVIAHRQSQTLLALSEEIPRARSTDSYWTLATKVLSHNDKDIPFALLYSVDADADEGSSIRTRTSAQDYSCTLRGSSGLPKDSPAGPPHLDLNEDNGFSPYFRKAMDAREPITIQLEKDTRAAELVRGIEWQGFGDPCRTVAICPLNPTSSRESFLGFMVIGINPRRPYDEDYIQFILVASRLLSTSLTSILWHEEDIDRRERTIADAETMRTELRNQLLESQKEAERNSWKFVRFAEFIDIGIFIVGTDGIYSYRNDAWFSILGTGDRTITIGNAWNKLIHDDYVPIGQARFEKLIETKENQSFELRLTKTWEPASTFDESIPKEHPKWQKYGENLQATQASLAQESKRQLENFIDTTSHEMRNPLSAIVQCADSIISAHKAFEKATGHTSAYQDTSNITVDAAETIVQCSKHMKVIVDDVLTMSKLDSGLFVMTPIDVQLESIARDAVRMFEGEAEAAGVGLEFRIHESCTSINADTISLDPTRVLQILINLLTNAIKFTRLEKTRHICVSLGVSLTEPRQDENGVVSFMRTSGGAEAKTLRADWERGEIVYVIFTVQDTGRGLSDAEHELLFTRFSQTSPRTHIDYGGSGLGLFISRRLTEMHGGAIGFASEAGVGSTFSFYIKSRKSFDSHQGNGVGATPGSSIKTQFIQSSGNGPSEGEEEKKSLCSNALATPVSLDIANADLHILIVEDNLVNQRVLAKQLGKLGMHVAVANHGVEALDYLRTTTYCVPTTTTTTTTTTPNTLSLILMDWEMPIMDGLSCVRHIRQLQDAGVVQGHVPVIAVTANVRSEQVQMATRAGMDDVVSKPFRIPELCACIQRTLRGLWGGGG